MSPPEVDKKFNLTPTLAATKAKAYGFSTTAIHVGSEPDPVTGAVIPPLSLSSTFKQQDIGVHSGFEYSRSGNPTRQGFETVVAALEGAKHGIAFASGSAALGAVLHALGGGRAIVMNDVYGGTYRFFTKVGPMLGWSVEFVDLTKPFQIANDVNLVWIETPTNPTLRVVDIENVARQAHAANAMVVVDNTFLSPYFQQPLSLGADIVVHSGTKYLNGHSDVVIGVAVTNNDELNERIRFMQNALGGVPSPFDCYLAQRGVKTLALRMKQHNTNATAVAHYLHDQGLNVIYPGLPSHPQHQIAAKQQSGYGGMITLVLDSAQQARQFVRSLRIFTLAESLGGVESLCEVPSIMTHASVSPKDRELLGISDGLVRLSCGIEDTNDLIQDIHQALSCITKV